MDAVGSTQANKHAIHLDVVGVVGVEVEAVPGRLESALAVAVVAAGAEKAVRRDDGGVGGGGRAADAAGAGREDEVVHHGHAADGRVRGRRFLWPGRGGRGGGAAPRVPEGGGGRRLLLGSPHAAGCQVVELQQGLALFDRWWVDEDGLAAEGR